ncbi:DoxX family protein [Salibacterium lacus]|uniref:DoxX family protein n=1 Tax=Salibacterium lacus TaxID=1898109 RepID=A0ABW5T3P0_9BACI
MKVFFRTLYSIILFGAGVLHFVRERSFRRIVPKALPLRRGIVLITGIFEMIFSALLWVRKGQRMTGKFLAFFMIAVFPANVYMAVKKISFPPGKQINPWVLWLRLPLQIPLVVGALTLGKKESN